MGLVWPVVGQGVDTWAPTRFLVFRAGLCGRRRWLHIDRKVLEKLVLVLVIEVVREEDLGEEKDGIVEQVLPWVATKGIEDGHEAIPVEEIFDSHLGQQSSVLC